MASGANLDGCSGPFDKCRGSNPYAGYRLTIGGQTRTIVGYSGHYKVVQLDAPLDSVRARGGGVRRSRSAVPRWHAHALAALRVCTLVLDGAR